MSKQDATTSTNTSGASISMPMERSNFKKAPKGPRFWAILFVLALAGLLTASEATITSTVLPVIVSKLGGGDNYIWAANGYFLTMSACFPLLRCIIQYVVVLMVCLFSRASLQPMFGQIANVFGRRWPMILSTVAFVIGSGISGGLVRAPRRESDITRGRNVLTITCV